MKRSVLDEALGSIHQNLIIPVVSVLNRCKSGGVSDINILAVYLIMSYPFQHILNQSIRMFIMTLLSLQLDHVTKKVYCMFLFSDVLSLLLHLAFFVGMVV